MCCNCCCNIQQKRCYQLGIMFTSVYIIVFEMVLAIFAENSMKPEELKDFILSEKPLFDFELSEYAISGKTEITFFDYKGRKVYNGNRTETKDKTNFTKIYGNKFFYNGKDRNYFDYKNKHSVKSTEDCPTNSKKCGILDSSGRKLCLPIDEECPLNGFKLTDTPDNPFIDITDIETKTVSYEVGGNHYIYYTNKNYDGEIITEFKLSKGPPCAKSSEISWFEYYQNEVEVNYKCKTYIGGSKTSNRYTKVNTAGINMRQLYRDNGLTTEPYSFFDRDTTTVDLFVRNYNELDEKCVNEFLKDFEEEKKYFDSAFKTARALSLIGLILILALFIYIMTTCSCCCNLTYHGIAIVVPIYGLVANIIIISITNKAKIKYECQKDGTDSKLEDEIDGQYGINTVSIVMSVLNIVGYAIVLMFTICLKFMRNKGIVVGVPIVTPGASVYPGAYPPTSYVTPYGPNIPYQNVIPGSY